MSNQIRLAPAPPPTNPKQPPRLLGSIRMSPLQYGSLHYIATCHRNGIIDIEELAGLKQTQIRSFMTNKWIEETKDRTGIVITDKGKRDLRAFTSNDQFFRREATMSFTSLLNLRLPNMAREEEAKPRRKSVERVTIRQAHRSARAS